jgi:hypothetical protein
MQQATTTCNKPRSRLACACENLNGARRVPFHTEEYCFYMINLPLLLQAAGWRGPPWAEGQFSPVLNRACHRSSMRSNMCQLSLITCQLTVTHCSCVYKYGAGHVIFRAAYYYLVGHKCYACYSDLQV